MDRLGMHSFAEEIDAPPLAPLPLNGQPLLDLRHLNHQTLNDPLLRNDVLELFLAETPKYIADLKAATDCKSWRMAVHTLKGAARNLGFAALGQLSEAMELDARQGSLTIAQSQRQALRQEVLAIQNYIQSYP